MNYITTTELRTKSSELVHALKRGDNISLVHRSQVIGEIKPVTKTDKVFNAARVEKILKKLNLKYIPVKERDRRYRKHLMEKYGKGLS